LAICFQDRFSSRSVLHIHYLLINTMNAQYKFSI